jgi:hypothetical protein
MKKYYLLVVFLIFSINFTFSQTAVNRVAKYFILDALSNDDNKVDGKSDLSKLSKEFVALTGKANPTMDDFLKIVGTSLNKTPNKLTDAEVRAYVKKNTELYNSILKKAEEEATRIVDDLMKNMSLKAIFDNAKIPQVYDNLKTLTSVVPTKSNVNYLEEDIDNHIAFVDELIKDNPGNKELKEMAYQLKINKELCVSFKEQEAIKTKNHLDSLIKLNSTNYKKLDSLVTQKYIIKNKEQCLKLQPNLENVLEFDQSGKCINQTGFSNLDSTVIPFQKIDGFNIPFPACMIVKITERDSLLKEIIIKTSSTKPLYWNQKTDQFYYKSKSPEATTIFDQNIEKNKVLVTRKMYNEKWINGILLETKEFQNEKLYEVLKKEKN